LAFPNFIVKINFSALCIFDDDSVIDKM